MATSGKKSKDMFTVVGKPGEMWIESYKNEERRVDDLSIQDYRRMIDNDGQIQMLFSAVCNTILAAGFDIVDDPDFEGEESSKEKEFIEEVLTSPAWKGGMSIDIETVNRTLLRSIIDGFRISEVVLKMGEDGMVHIDKIAPRAGKDDKELFLLVDDNGEFNGIRQYTSFNGAIVDVTIMNQGDINKVIKTTIGEEFGSNYGRSMLRAPWYHYDKAHKTMYLIHVGTELGSVKFRKLEHKLNDKEKIATIVADLQKVGLESVFAYNNNEMTLTFEDVSDASVLAVGKDMVNLHYSLIAKSWLAQFIDLGSQSAETGSRALGDSQVSFFKEGLQAIATATLEKTWNKIIADIIKINFGGDTYPQFKVKPIRDESVGLVYEAFLEMVKKGVVSQSVSNEIQLQATGRLGLDVTEEMIEEDMMKKQQEDQMKSAQEMEMLKVKVGANEQMQNMQKEMKPNMKVEKPTQLEEEMMAESMDHPTSEMRPLYPDEEKVKMGDIKMRLEQAEATSKMNLSTALLNQKDDIINTVIEAVRGGKSKVRTLKIDLAETANYSQQLLIILYEMLEYGKVIAANELNKSVPETSKADRRSTEDDAIFAIEDQETRLTTRLKAVAVNGIDSGLPESEIRNQLGQEYNNFFESVLSPTIALLIPKTFNKGRGISFDAYKSDVFAYRYTAVLDEMTTDYCRRLDGRVFQETDPQYSMLTPPNHFGCRSMWTPITNQESGSVVVNGKPVGLPTYSSVSTFRDT